jgi:hypothetical protein
MHAEINASAAGWQLPCVEGEFGGVEWLEAGAMVKFKLEFACVDRIGNFVYAKPSDPLFCPTFVTPRIAGPRDLSNFNFPSCSFKSLGTLETNVSQVVTKCRPGAGLPLLFGSF